MPGIVITATKRQQWDGERAFQPEEQQPCRHVESITPTPGVEASWTWREAHYQVKNY